MMSQVQLLIQGVRRHVISRNGCMSYEVPHLGEDIILRPAAYCRYIFPI